MMRDWIEPSDVIVPEEFQAAIGGHPLVTQMLVRRGFAEVKAARAFLDADYYHPAPPADLPDMDRAVDRVQRAIQRQETICVWGDFDVDGQTATTLLVSTLRDLGAVVQYYIPDRERESHGINLPVLKRLIAQGVGLVLTCDTGISAHEAIAHARSRGVDVVVTDHHDLPPLLPEAEALVNPKRLPIAHPLRELPGVGCAYKLAEALYERTGRPQAVEQYLDLVALGIVSDVATQTGDTRYLLQRGIESLRNTQRLGLQVMMETAELYPHSLTEEHIGFVLGPRLNALGRLANASVAVEFLITDDMERARVLATELEGLNARRRLLCDQVTQAAETQIERDPSLLEQGVLVLSHPSWPGGVIGIVAGRLAERYNRPTILFTTPPDELARGSARSIQGCNITAAIAAHKEMLVRFGGHPMAAGLTIDPDRIPEFRRVLSRTVLEMLGKVEERATLQIDGYLSLADLTLDLVKELERLAPFGPGNPPPVLVSKDLSSKSHSPVGRNGEHLQMTVEDAQGIAQQVIWWQGGGSSLPQGRFDLAYVVRASDYRGRRDVQVEWLDARPVEITSVVRGLGLSSLEVVDYRQEPNPWSLLQRVRSQEEDVQVWSEAGARDEVMGKDRHELGLSKALVIWTAPPGPHELRAVLDRVAPERVYLFGIDPGFDSPGEFLNRLAGLVKHTRNAYQGHTKISKLAAATAQRETTLWMGINFFVARGDLKLLSQEGDEICLDIGGQTVGSDSLDLGTIMERLRALLQETAAYRVHFARAEKETLVRKEIP